MSTTQELQLNSHRRTFQLKKLIKSEDKQPDNTVVKSKIFAKKEQQKVQQEQKVDSFQQTKTPVIPQKTAIKCVQGPSVEIDRKYISFQVQTGKIVTENVNLINKGSTAITFEWVKCESSNLSGYYDTEERFFCHHKKNVMNPGDVVNFSFSFLSKITGIFYDNWMLKFEPSSNQSPVILKLIGHSIEPDACKQFRDNFTSDLNKNSQKKLLQEKESDDYALTQIVVEPEPDLTDANVRKQIFEQQNLKLKLYYSDHSYNWYKYLESLICDECQIDQDQRQWDLSVLTLKQQIDDLVQDDDQRNYFTRVIQI